MNESPAYSCMNQSKTLLKLSPFCTPALDDKTIQTTNLIIRVEEKNTIGFEADSKSPFSAVAE